MIGREFRGQVADIPIAARGAGWLVVAKPSGLLVHPSGPSPVLTLDRLLRQWLAPEISDGGQVSLVHRLDRETSGLLLVATRAETASYFSRQIERGAMTKEYRAIVHGWPEWQEHVIDAPILRQGSRGPSRIWLKQAVDAESAGARTKFSVLRRIEKGGNKFSLLAARPRTGRMHQIHDRVGHEHLVIEAEVVEAHHEIGAHQLVHEVIDRAFGVNPVAIFRGGKRHADRHAHGPFVTPAADIASGALGFEVGIDDVLASHAERQSSSASRSHKRD